MFHAFLVLLLLLLLLLLLVLLLLLLLLLLLPPQPQEELFLADKVTFDPVQFLPSKIQKGFESWMDRGIRSHVHIGMESHSLHRFVVLNDWWQMELWAVLVDCVVRKCVRCVL